MKIITHSETETYELGRELGARAAAGGIWCLDGDLGTGKTVFTKGFAAGLGVTEPVVSPTFTIIHEYYDGRLPLYHFDVYRIEDPDEMLMLGYEEYFYGEGVCLIEWASQIEELIPSEAHHVLIEKDYSAADDCRVITIDIEDTL